MNLRQRIMGLKIYRQGEQFSAGRMRSWLSNTAPELVDQELAEMVKDEMLLRVGKRYVRAQTSASLLRRAWV